MDHWDISDFTASTQNQASAEGASSSDPRHISPGSGGAWSSAYREPSASGETVYDLQGLVSHSGTLHGVSTDYCMFHLV